MPDKSYVTLGFTRGTNIVSKLIQRVDDSAINHVFWVFPPTTKDGGKGTQDPIVYPYSPLVYESRVGAGVQLNPMSHLARAMAAGKVEAAYFFRLEVSGGERRAALWDECTARHANRYGYREILNYYLWQKLNFVTGKFLKKMQNASRYTCNELCGTTAKAAGIEPFLAGYDETWTPERMFKIMTRGVSSKMLHKALNTSLHPDVTLRNLVEPDPKRYPSVWLERGKNMIIPAKEAKVTTTKKCMTKEELTI